MLASFSGSPAPEYSDEREVSFLTCELVKGPNQEDVVVHIFQPTIHSVLGRVLHVSRILSLGGGSCINTLSRGVWRHAPQDKFGILGPLRLFLMQSER